MRIMQRLLAAFVLLLLTGVCLSPAIGMPVRTVFAETVAPDEGIAAPAADAAVPKIEFIRRMSGNFASDSSALTVVYELVNAGVVPVADVVVSDPLGSFSETTETLAPGERKHFVQHVSIDADSVSAPVLTYTANDGLEKYSVQLDEANVFLAHSLLDVSLTAGRSIFATDTAEVILRLENNGNAAFRNVVIYDDIYGGVIADSIQLPAGSEPLEISRSCPLRGTANFRWRVTGENEAGDRIDFITETVTVYADEISDEVLLTLDASAGMSRIARKGMVPVTLSVSNISSGMATNVQLREETLGEIATLAVVPTGDPMLYTLHCEVNADTVYHFSAVYTDPSGQQRVAEAAPVEIIIASGGEIPQTADQPNSLLQGNPQQLGESPLFWILLAGSCAVLLVLVILLLAATRRDRIERKVREEVRRQRMKRTARREHRST